MEASTERSAARRPQVADVETRVVRKERRQARIASELTELFSERAELRGVSAAAELLADSVRWSA